MGASRASRGTGRTPAGDEHGLPEEVRVLMLRAMVAAAWADGRIQDAEAQLIARKLDALQLSAAARQEVEAELRAPPPLERALAAVDSPELRPFLYRNVAAVVMADGRIETRETRFLMRVAAALGLPRAEAERIDEELYNVVAAGGLDALVGAATRTLAPGAKPRR